MIFNIKVEDKDDNIHIENINYRTLESELPQEPNKEYGFDNILNIYRNKIDKIPTDVWKKIRWYINDYDFLVKDPLINRAFYKYWEIINVFNIFEKYDIDNDKIFHCAEAPGGFIQGTNMFLHLNNYSINDNNHNHNNHTSEDGFITVVKKNKQKKKPYKIFSISLNKDLPKYKNYNLPSYNKKVINKYVCVTYGKDNTGDINNLDNINYIDNIIGERKCHLVTADGGFDEGNDFNNKEQLHYLLILNEIYASIYLQRKGGNFILKVFDIFTDTSINLLYLLNLIYSEVYIYKPKTSRPTNSEKYIICKNFKLNDTKSLLDKLYNLSNKLASNKNKYNAFKLFDNIPDSFIKNIKHMNKLLLEHQCHYLKTAIDLCDSKEFINNYELELEKLLGKRKIVFKQWQNKYNLHY